MEEDQTSYFHNHENEASQTRCATGKEIAKYGCTMGLFRLMERR